MEQILLPGPGIVVRQRGGTVSRGPAPRSAIDAALKIAWTRGFVTVCQRGRGTACDLVIHAATYSAVVAIVRCRRLHGTLAEMQAQCAEPIARLQLVPQAVGRSLELWACSPYGGMRFFRVQGSGLLELSRDGVPLVGLAGRT